MRKLIGIFFLLCIFCINSGNAQSFIFQFISDTVSFGLPGGNDIVVKGNIINTGTVDVEVDIIRKENNLPSGWTSYMCTDVCMNPPIDSSRLYLSAGLTQLFKLSFSTTNVLDTANCLIKFKNVSTNNSIQKRMWGITNPNAGLKEYSKTANRISVYPIPAADRIFIPSAIKVKEMRILNSQAMIIQMQSINENSELIIENLSAGLYFISSIDEKGIVWTGKFIKL